MRDSRSTPRTDGGAEVVEEQDAEGDEAGEQTTPTNQEVARYRCPYCKETFSNELFARAHVTWSEDDDHANQNGFMPEVTIDGIAADGTVVTQFQGHPRRIQEEDATLSSIPDEYTEVEKTILVNAIKHPHEKYSEIEKGVNEKLVAQDKETVDYNKVYRTIKDGLAVKTGGSKSYDEKTFDDLTSRQKKVIAAYARDPSQSMTEVATTAGVDASYPQQVVDNFSDIASDLRESGDIPDPDDIGEEEEKSPEEKYNELTTVQKRVVDVIAKNPGMSNTRVSDVADCAASYPTRIKRKFEDVIDWKMDELGTSTADEEEAQKPEFRTRPAETYDELTDNQKAIVDELVKEDDPNDPDRTQKEIAIAAAGGDEDEAVHPTYVGDTITNYGDLAVAIKDQQEEDEEEEEEEAPAEADTATDQAVTGAAARPMTASPQDMEGEAEAEWVEVEDAETVEEVEEEVATISGEKKQNIIAAALDYPEYDYIDIADEVSASDGYTKQVLQDLHNGEFHPVAIADIHEDMDVEEIAQRLHEGEIASVEERDREEVEVEAEVEAEAEPAEAEAEPAEAEAEPAEAESAAAVEAAATPADAEAETASAAAAQEGAVSRQDVAYVRDMAATLRRTAEAEVEFADSLSAAHGRKAVAEELERALNDVLGETDEDGEPKTTEATPIAAQR